MDKKVQYAQGIVSLQISVNSSNGEECCVVVRDPKLAEREDGYMWAGGYFFPSGNMYRAVEHIQNMQTGALLEEGSLSLRQIVYSRTLKGHWIANHAFTARAKPLEEWKKPEIEGYEVFLVEKSSLVGEPKIVKVVRGEERKNSFNWRINDGRHLAGIVFREKMYCKTADSYFSKIPVVDTLTEDAFNLPHGYGLNIGSLIVPHIYKGKKGLVFILNKDSDKFGLIGGKVESLEGIESGNIDLLSCVFSEAKEETGVDFLPTSIVGCAMTPITAVRPNYPLEKGGVNSIINTCILAKPLNPRQLDEAIRENKPRESGKIEGIYHIPNEDLESVLSLGMRTPDMSCLLRNYLSGVPSLRANLEGIVVIDNKDNRFSRGGGSETILV